MKKTIMAIIFALSLIGCDEEIVIYWEWIPEFDGGLDADADFDADFAECNEYCPVPSPF